ncbi:protein kinase family protein [Clostridium estertheticum]|uniref:protein kinase family protein n=1 Tax=Clostridium estertheticum TaxID=238834 RepID=UPI001C0E43FA|nr:protein kinase family protein [Clostridium estertheticum]MBU3185035.1 protein kinase family protein [Clostridium estertheticum]
MWPLSRKKYFGKQVGKYIIEKPIGEGRYGVCFLAKTDIYDKVVIKKFKKSIFKRKLDSNVYEAVILSKLSDNGIPEFLGVINQKGFYAFVLEFKNGFTVEDLLFKYKYKFTNKEFFDIGFKLIKIITYIHGNGVVHRDIRIPNVLIDKGELYLIDFGLARWADNNKYPYDLDFSYLGEFLLYLLYSSFEAKEKHKKLPWYKELNLTNKQKLFLKKLLGLEKVYKNIEDIKMDFSNVFGV